MSLVLELQRECLESNVDYISLLRKALLIARKLELSDFKNWIDCELNGYAPENQELPAYRKIRGTLICRTVAGHEVYPDLGTMRDVKRDIETNPCRHSISYIVDYADQTHNEIKIHVDGARREWLSQFIESPFQINFWVLYSNSDFKNILNRVQTLILEWTLLLESENILGEGISFSAIDKSNAKSNKDIHNYYTMNILGDVVNSKLQNGTIMSDQN